MANVTTTIVVAEDDAELRALYAGCLRKDGHLVLEACDGGEALALVSAHGPDLLVLDIWMPVLNGLEVLERLNQSAEAMGLSIVVLTQATDADVLLEGFALGVEECWTKDLSLDELCARVQAVLARARPPRGGPTGPMDPEPKLGAEAQSGAERAGLGGRVIGS